MLNISPIYGEWLRAGFTPVLAVSLLLLGRRISRLSPKLRNCISIVAVALAISSVAAYRQPQWITLGRTVVSVGGALTIAGCVLLLLVGIARPEKGGGVLNIALCLAFAILQLHASVPLYWHYLAHNSIENYPDSHGLIEQSTGVTCVPAAASMLLNRYGFRVSEGSMAERAGTDILTGTDDFSLARALNSVIGKRGLKASYNYLNYDQAVKLNRPFIATIDLPKLGRHAVMVVSPRSNGLSIYDPLFGAAEELSASEFKTEWTGAAVWISRP